MSIFSDRSRKLFSCRPMTSAVPIVSETDSLNLGVRRVLKSKTVTESAIDSLRIGILLADSSSTSRDSCVLTKYLSNNLSIDSDVSTESATSKETFGSLSDVASLISIASFVLMKYLPKS